MSAGSARASELRHPERAAAWLRRRALLAARRPSESRPGTRPERSAVLMELGVQGPALAALEGLSLEDRAAIVAASIERLAMADVATILGRDLERTRRTVRAARRRYTSAAVHWLASEPGATPLRGEISDRVEQAATRAIGPGVIGPRATGSLW